MVASAEPPRFGAPTSAAYRAVSAGYNPCRRAGCSSPRAWCIGWIPRSRRRASPPRFCGASTPATRRRSSPRSVRTVPPSGAGTNHEVDPRCGAGRAAASKYVRECRPVGRTSKPAVPLPPLRASSCRWAHLSGPCLRFRKGCFPLPACQLPTGSSPWTSLSANSSIMLRSYPAIPKLAISNPPIQLTPWRPSGRLNLDGWIDCSAICFGAPLQVLAAQLHGPSGGPGHSGAAERHADHRVALPLL
jgi:hypothetical protein